MNLSGIGSLLDLASRCSSAATPLGALRSLASNALGGAPSRATGASDPFSAIVEFTKDVDGIASAGLGGGLFASIAGMLA